MNAVSTMNEVSGIYELSAEQLDEVNGGFNWGYWEGVTTAATAGSVLGMVVGGPGLAVVGTVFAVGAYNGYHDSHH
jgi:hypothetical protein